MSFSLNEFKNKKVHIIGIGGSMMSGIAAILLENGIAVSGSDAHESKALDRVRKLGASIKTVHHKDNIYDQDLVIYTAAVKDNNPELVEARRRGIETMSRSQFLGHLLHNFQQSVGVAGTHGKTSTTSMLNAITASQGYDPTVLVGAIMPETNTNYRVGKSEIMVVESCEYQRSFLDFPAKISIILNIEEDHVDIYKDIEEVKSAFVQYVQSIPSAGCLIANADDANVMEVAQKATVPVLSFGVDEGDLRAKDITVDEKGRASFTVNYKGDDLFAITLPVAGTFHVYNSLAAILACLELGLKPNEIKDGLENYQGVSRRMQGLGEINGVRFIDDYGHHPTEVRVTMETVLHMDYQSLIVVEQPHTFSRLHRFFDDFVPLFDEADLLILLPVFAAREDDNGLTSSEKLGDAIRERKTVKTLNAKDYQDAANMVLSAAREGDLVLLIGAGEGYRIYDYIAENDRLCKQSK